MEFDLQTISGNGFEDPRLSGPHGRRHRTGRSRRHDRDTAADRAGALARAAPTLIIPQRNMKRPFCACTLPEQTLVRSVNLINHYYPRRLNGSERSVEDAYRMAAVCPPWPRSSQADGFTRSRSCDCGLDFPVDVGSYRAGRHRDLIIVARAHHKGFPFAFLPVQQRFNPVG